MSDNEGQGAGAPEARSSGSLPLTLPPPHPELTWGEQLLPHSTNTATPPAVMQRP